MSFSDPHFKGKEGKSFLLDYCGNIEFSNYLSVSRYNCEETSGTVKMPHRKRETISMKDVFPHVPSLLYIPAGFMWGAASRR